MVSEGMPILLRVCVSVFRGDRKKGLFAGVLGLLRDLAVGNQVKDLLKGLVLHQFDGGILEDLREVGYQRIHKIRILQSVLQDRTVEIKPGSEPRGRRCSGGNGQDRGPALVFCLLRDLFRGNEGQVL